MSRRPHGHARVSALNPEAFARCDRCGFVYNLVDLIYQRQWAGPKTINTRLKVCKRCLDTPQEQLRTLRLRPDPVPVRDPRPLNDVVTMGGYAVMTRSARATTATPGIPLYPGTETVLANTPRGDFGADLSADFAGPPTSAYVSGGNSNLGGDASPDAGPDAVIYGLPTQHVALSLMLEVMAPGNDAIIGYPASPFSAFYADTNQDAGPDAGVDGLAAIPVSIDPPES